MILVHEGEETERLVFGLLEDKYFDEWLPLFEAENVPTYLGMDPKLSAKELCQLWFDKIYHRYENNLGGMHVLTDKASGRFVGQCGLLVQEVEGEERLEIGYSILPQYWRQGYALEAAVRCKELAFERKYATSLISVVHIDNIGSEKVARKNGMHLEKKIASYKGMPVKIFRIDQ